MKLQIGTCDNWRVHEEYVTAMVAGHYRSFSQPMAGPPDTPASAVDCMTDWNQGEVMFELKPHTGTSKREHYAELLQQARALLAGEHDLIANAANFSALVYHSLPQLNWAGFYLYDGHELVLGPFQGKPACIRTALGRGVCGTAAQTRATQLVADVNAFAGHIACDAASQSEIVVPLLRDDGSLLGVWDVDSPITQRFDDEDRVGMQALCAVFVASLAGPIK